MFCKDWPFLVHWKRARTRLATDLSLIQPTAVGRRVMDGQSVPDLRRHFRTKDIRQRFAAVDVQVVQHQMDGFRLRVCQCQADRYLSDSKPERSGVAKVKC